MIADKIESMFRSDKDRLANLERNKIRGVGRVLYTDRKVKLSNIESLVASNKGLALTKLSTMRPNKSETTKPDQV